MENTETTPAITIHVDLAAVQKLRQYYNERKFQHMAKEAAGFDYGFAGMYRGEHGPCVVGCLLSDDDAHGWDRRSEEPYTRIRGYTLNQSGDDVAVTSTADSFEVRRLLERAQIHHDNRQWSDLGDTISELEVLVTS